MSGITGLTEAEQKIYDEFEAGGRALLEKAKADAAAIGADITSIIGPVEKAAVKTEVAVTSWFGKLWRWIVAYPLQIIDDPKGKFSHKRIIALAAAVVAIRQLVIADYWGALGAGVACVVLAVISAVTKT